MKSKLKGLLLLGAIAAAIVAVPSASALHSSEHYSLFGEASYVMPGNASARAVHLVSDAAPGFSGVDFDVESGLTFADLDQLSTDYKFESDDSCDKGSPRFQINVEDATSGDTGNIWAYLGSAPNYNDCPSGVWLNSGDLLGGALTVDTSQLDGGAPYDPYASALAKYGAYTVTGIQLVADSGWGFEDGEQALDVDNTVVDSTLFTYEVPDDEEPETPTVVENKDQCKNGGWQDLTDDEGNSFKNQGACVSFAARNK